MRASGEITSPADGDCVAIRKPGEVVKRHSCRRTGEGAGIQLDPCALTRAARPLPKGEVTQLNSYYPR